MANWNQINNKSKATTQIDDAWKLQEQAIETPTETVDALSLAQQQFKEWTLSEENRQRILEETRKNSSSGSVF